MALSVDFGMSAHPPLMAAKRKCSTHFRNGALDPSLQIGALGFRSAHGSLTPISLAAFSCFDDQLKVNHRRSQCTDRSPLGSKHMSKNGRINMSKNKVGDSVSTLDKKSSIVAILSSAVPQSALAQQRLAPRRPAPRKPKPLLGTTKRMSSSSGQEPWGSPPPSAPATSARR